MSSYFPIHRRQAPRFRNVRAGALNKPFTINVCKDCREVNQPPKPARSFGGWSRNRSNVVDPAGAPAARVPHSSVTAGAIASRRSPTLNNEWNMPPAVSPGGGGAAGDGEVVEVAAPEASANAIAGIGGAKLTGAAGLGATAAIGAAPLAGASISARAA